MSSHALRHVIQAADHAIMAEDFDALMDFYTEDATLVIRPGLLALGKAQIRRAFVAIADHFNHSLVISQDEMQVIEGGDTALVLAKAVLGAVDKQGVPLQVVRRATYVFKRVDGQWRCAVDNSYGTDLLHLK